MTCIFCGADRAADKDCLTLDCPGNPNGTAKIAGRDEPSVPGEDRLMHYSEDMFSGSAVCGMFMETGQSVWTSDDPLMINCDLCMVGAFPWLEDYVARRIRDGKS